MNENTERRLARLKYRRTVQGKPDDYLMLLLDDASDMFREITHRDDPGEKVDGLICELASYMSNYEGIEYTTTAKDGEMERQNASGTIPDPLYKRIIAYRVVR